MWLGKGVNNIKVLNNVLKWGHTSNQHTLICSTVMKLTMYSSTHLLELYTIQAV